MVVERSYRKRPSKVDFFWNPYGIGYSTGHWLCIGRKLIKHYVEVSETDQKISWDRRYLRIFRRDSPEDMKLLLQELPDRIIHRLTEKYPDLFPEEGSDLEEEDA